MIPLYKEELDYKVEYGMDKLLQKCPDEILEVINPSRLNAVTDAEILNYDDREMDCAADHLKLIQEHNLSVGNIIFRLMNWQYTAIWRHTCAGA